MNDKGHYIDAWDLLIAHPPCTYLSNAGARHLWKGHVLQADRVMKGIEGRDLFMRFWWADEDYAKMIHGMMEAREKERMLGIRVLIIAHNAYKFQGCAQIYRNYLPQHIAIHVRKQYLAELNRKRKSGRNAQSDSH